MFRVNTAESSHLYKPDILSPAPKGVVLFDFDGTIGWGTEPAPLWESPPDYRGDYLWWFKFEPSDVYIPPAQNATVLRDVPLSPGLKTSVKGFDMHAFKIKRNRITYFIAKFVERGSTCFQTTDAGKFVEISPKDIVIPSPDYLMMTCYILLLNGYFVELATQRLVMFAEDAKGVKANSATAMLLWGLNVCLRSRRKFFRHAFSQEVIDSFFRHPGGVKAFDKAQSNSKTNLIKLALDVLQKPLETVILVDDNQDYKDTTKNITHFIAANELRRDDPYRHLREVLEHCKINADMIRGAIATLRIYAECGGSDIDDRLVENYTHDVLRQLTQDEVQRRQAANNFNHIQLGSKSPIYALAASARGIIYAVKDQFYVLINLAPLYSNIGLSDKPRAFAIDYADDDSYVLGGRLAKKGKKQDGYLAVVNSKGTILHRLPLHEHGTIVALACIGNKENREVVTLNTLHKANEVSFARYLINKGQMPDNFVLTVKSLCDKDSVNRKRFDVCSYFGPSARGFQKVACVSAARILGVQDGDMGHYSLEVRGGARGVPKAVSADDSLALHCVVYSTNSSADRVDYRLRLYSLPKALCDMDDSITQVHSGFLDEQTLMTFCIFNDNVLRVIKINDVWSQTYDHSPPSQVKEGLLLRETTKLACQIEQPAAHKITSIALQPDENRFAIAWVCLKNKRQTYIQFYKIKEGSEEYECEKIMAKNFGEVTSMTWAKIVGVYYLVCGNLQGGINIVPVLL